MTERPAFEQFFRKRPDDEAIPVLTEVLQPTAPVPSAPPAADPVAEEAQPLDITQRIAALDSGELARLSDLLRESVLTRLHPRIDSALERGLDEAVRSTLEQELPALQRKLRETLSAALNDIVSRAISKELARLYSQRARKPDSDSER